MKRSVQSLKVAVVTTARSDYGLLCPLLKELKKDPAFRLYLIATGSHLSRLHGRTLDAIKKDGFSISETVQVVPRGDRSSDISEAIARGIKGFSKVFEKMNPDLVLFLGDRYELLFPR